ncbi:MAG: IS1634 family transposase [Nitrospira sp.]|nr:IS1634 family transposase [Nitrospira sp.]
MYIDVVPNRNSPPAILLRESFREGGKVRKRTVANLSGLSMQQVDSLRLLLKGRPLAPVDELFDIVASRHHGHAAAVVTAIKRLKLDKLLAANACRQRQLVLAMIAARIIDPRSKLATATCLTTTTLPELLDAQDATEDELYTAMDWLLERQEAIEAGLAKRHLHEGAMALYDLSSSYVEGSHCPLAAYGYNRDGKKGKLQVNYGLLTDRRGCPVAVSVFKGNVGDTKTLMPQVRMLRERFGLADFVLVGDRGMITQKQVNELREEDVQWIAALRPGAIDKLVSDNSIQPTPFDDRNLAEIEHDDFPGERLVVCRNPELAKRRAAKRRSLLEATTKELEKVRGMVESGRLQDDGKIGVRVGRVVNKHKVAKHFTLDIGDGHFAFETNEQSIADEAALDGLYVVRTSLPADRMQRDDVVRSYKQLTQVERCFRSMKTMDLHVRPIYHRTEDRVRAHILLCTLAYYVRWHMLEAWRPLLLCDEQLDAKAQRDPVAPAKRSAAADNKAATKRTDDGERAHSFQTLLRRLATIVRNTCRRPAAEGAEATIDVDTRPTELQQKALDLVASIQL